MLNADAKNLDTSRQMFDSQQTREMNVLRAQISKDAADRTAKRLENSDAVTAEKAKTDADLAERKFKFEQEKARFKPTLVEGADGKLREVVDGKYLPGDKLPTTRNMEMTAAQQAGVSQDTAKPNAWLTSLFNSKGDPSQVEGYIPFVNQFGNNDFDWKVEEVKDTTLGFDFGQKKKVLVKVPKTTVTPVTPTAGSTVRVKSPDGKTGSIPAARLQDYLNNGYKQVP